MANIITELALEMNANWYVSKKLNSIGRVGENTVTKLIIEPTEILDNVTYEIEIADASGSKNVAELTIDGTELYLILTANMLTVSGIMKMQVRGLFTDGSIKKSNIFELKVNRSISATEHYEEYAVTIFDQLVAECRDIIEGAESYAVRAETAAVNAEVYSESASSSAEAASVSASNASGFADNAATSAANAATSETNASTSATNASASETNAATSATNAANSATSASTSATNAANSATSAATSATNAANSATNASTSETNASTSATEAADSAASIAASVAQINENTYRINDLEAIIAGYQLEDLPTGSVATITDGTALLMPSLKIGIEPVQDLHGYDHPWAGGAGKNLFDNAQTFIKDKYIDVNGAIQNTTYGWEVSDYIPLKNNTNYYISGNNVTGASAYDALYDSDKNLVRTLGYSSSNHNGAFTTDANEFYIRICTQESVVNNVQLEEGSTATSYEPYSNICPISGWSEANATRTGKNLFDANNFAIGYYVSRTTTFSENAPAGVFTLKFKYYKAGTYTLSGNIETKYYYITKKLSATTSEMTVLSSLAVKTFTIETSGEYSFQFNSGDANNFDRYKNNIQIELGSTATTYEPYNGTTYNIQFRDGDNPLTVYGGTLDVTTGELVVDRVSVDMGNLSWAYDISYNRFASDSISNTVPPSGARITSFISSIYEVIDDGRPISQVTSGQMYSSFDSTQTSAIVMVHDNRFTDATEFKTAVTGQTFVYELATPTTYHLTPTQIRTLVGNNNIWADTGNIIEGKYFKSLS